MHDALIEGINLRIDQGRVSEIEIKGTFAAHSLKEFNRSTIRCFGCHDQIAVGAGKNGMGIHCVGCEEHLFHGVLRSRERPGDQPGTMPDHVGIQSAEKVDIGALGNVVDILGERK